MCADKAIGEALAAVLSVAGQLMAASNLRWWRTSLAVASDVNGPKISQPCSWRSLCTARSAIQSEPTTNRRHPSKLLRIVAPLQSFLQNMVPSIEFNACCTH
jgi:hypothetical protein